MIDANQVKETVKALGADLCGIAPAERFVNAPKGFHPRDVYGKCKSVVVFAKKVPIGPLYAESCVPYTIVNKAMIEELDRLTFRVLQKLEDMGLRAVPIPSDDPYEHWEADRSYGRAILSLKHAAHLAGLGRLGKNTLLINSDYGNMVELGAVLVDAELEGDPIATYDGCLAECSLCIDSCPAAALDGETVDQQRCRPHSNFVTEKGYNLQKCYTCRSVCLHALGIKD
jgi:epoxyqueuosine reductase QueG